MSARWRVIDFRYSDPSTNMAIDEALFRGYLERGAGPTLRLYGWRPAGISIGYAQDPDTVLDLDRCRQAGVPVVRRMTGGGAIVHDRELTYSLVCSRDDLSIPPRVTSSYRAIASFLIAFYRSLGLDAVFACEASDDSRLGKPSAACFAGREKYDILVGGRKIGGSAQKRAGSVIFQHGSIPLRIDGGRAASFLRDKKAAALMARAASLEELLTGRIDVTELSALLVRSFVSTFGIAAEKGELSAVEKTSSEELRLGKYAADEWNRHRIDKTQNSNLVSLTRLD